MKAILWNIKNLFSLLFICTIISMQAQTQITGKVINEQNEAVSFANVLVLNVADSSLLKGVVTDIDGNYELSFPIAKNQFILLNISMIGYAPIYQKTMLQANKINTISTIVLPENATELEGIEVVAKKPLYSQEIDRTVINVQNSITSAGGNALEILSKSPGVQVDRANNVLAVMGKQGVIVMINGKRNRMDLSALIQLLANLPANNIEKIEVITTPPANFDAEGSAGIINIILVKNIEDGFNGNIGSNFGYSLRPKMGINTNFNFRKGKLNLYGDFSYNRELVQARTIFSSTIRFNNMITQTEGSSERPATQTFHNARLGLDYQLSDKTVLGVLFSGYSTLWELDAYTNTTTISNTQPAIYENLRSIEKNHWLHGMTNFSITHDLNKTEKIDFNYDYLYYVDNNPTDYFQQTFNELNTIIEVENFQSRKNTPITIQVAKLDYSKKINDKLSYEMGLKGTSSNFTNDISVAYQENNDWFFDSDYTNIFELKEQIAAAYLSGNYQLNEQTTLKAGLRYEYFTANLQDETDANLVSRKSGNIFPSVFLSRKINADHLLQGSYSRRIQRPNFDQLAPALFFFGPNMISRGNLNIRQTFTDNFKLDYRYKAYSFSLQYNYEDAPITFGQPLILAEKNQVVLQAANMESQKMIAGMFNLPFELANWWTTRLNLNGYLVTQNPLIDGQVIERTNFTYSLHTANDFKLPKGYNLALSCNYNSKFQYGIADVPERWNINVGVQKSFNDFKVAFNWNDIFSTNNFWDMRVNKPDLNRISHFRYELEGSIARLSVSYSFGKKDLKSARNRQTGSEEERRRVN